MENKNPKNILVVDDDREFVDALKTFLVGHGYSVVIARDALFATQNACKESTALLILDLGLPCGGGFFVLENIRKFIENTKLPIIISTANVSVGVEKKCRNLGANDFIEKPYDLEKLLEIIKKYLP
ncbi:MAG: response regulator [Candidatus Omnitrophica bacterium]|nr:response regulator [Candidatus Omnitrophota bacterium]